MPVYSYTAVNKGGKSTKGSIDAESVRVARQKLRSQGFYPTAINEAGEVHHKQSRDLKKYFQATSVSMKDLGIATRQLATLIAAGLPLVSALNAMAEQTESAVLKRIVVDVREEVEEGSALNKALAKYPKTFSRFYINLVAAGEASGTLDTVLAELADYLEAQNELKRKIGSALVYPILMLFVCSAVVLGLFIFVIPKVVDVFQKQKVTLPLPTQVMIFISDTLIRYWFVIAALIPLILFSVRWYYKQPHGRERIDMLLLKIPIWGRLNTKIITSRVASTLGALLASGVELLRALDITKNIIGNVHIVKALEKSIEGVREGRSLASEFKSSGLFPPMLSHMVAVGERSGALESMLGRAGKAYEKEVDASIEGLTSLLEPLLMIVVGIIVLCIVVSVLLPMADLIDVMGG